MALASPASKPKSLVLEYPAADPQAANDHFLAKLSVETDSWDVYQDLQAGEKGFIVVDPRSPETYAKEHIPGALGLFHRTIEASTTASLPKDKLIVVYCTGPGCNASTKAAARLASLGFRVKEMIGGLEWWKKSGYPTEGADVR
jgi:rhodanese-related sulfurtransferase